MTKKKPKPKPKEVSGKIYVSRETMPIIDPSQQINRDAAVKFTTDRSLSPQGRAAASQLVYALDFHEETKQRLAQSEADIARIKAEVEAEIAKPPISLLQQINELRDNVDANIEALHKMVAELKSWMSHTRVATKKPWWKS